VRKTSKISLLAGNSAGLEFFFGTVYNASFEATTVKTAGRTIKHPEDTRFFPYGAYHAVRDRIVGLGTRIGKTEAFGSNP
jgi:hypothetical protein